MEKLEQLYKVRDAAARLALSEAALRKWVLLRKINIVRIGRSVRLSETELLRLMQVIPAREAR